jgi:hypothetical protein
VDSFGDNARGRRQLFPDNYQPVRVNVLGLRPSVKAGAPELQLIVCVTRGPFQGYELDRFSSNLYMTLPDLGKPQANPGRTLGLIKTNLGLWNHMTRALTGQPCDGAVLQQFGFQLGQDPQGWAQEIAAQFHRLDANAKCHLVAGYCRLQAWDGKEAVAYIDLRAEAVKRRGMDGTLQAAVDPQTGQPEKRLRNNIVNFFALDDPQHGLAVWERSYLPQLNAQYAQLQAAGQL